MTSFRLNFALAILFLSGLVINSPSIAQQPPQESSNVKIKIGTYDSRCIAIAYYRSEKFKQAMKDLHTSQETLKSAGKLDVAARMEKEGIALQTLVHQQSFGTWPIDVVLKKLDGQLADIAAQAEVDILVSKWDITYQRSGIKLTDVTNLMVKPFNPTAETLKIIQDIHALAPIAAKELENHQD